MEIIEKADGTVVPVVKDGDNPDLMTQEQIARMLDVAVSTVSKRISALGLEPVVPTTKAVGSYGNVPAKYSLAQFSILQQQQAKIENEKQLLIKKHVDALTTNEKSAVMQQYVEELKQDESPDSTRAMIANAAGFISMLNDRLKTLFEEVEDLKEEKKQLLLVVEEQNKLLDRCENEMTVEQYCVRNNYEFTQQQCGQVTKKLHNRGLNHIRTIKSPLSGLVVCVWSKEVLDEYFYNLGE